ncbi:MAG: dihydrofolate reductase [Tissierellia bacterium]|nr:dihydrofolate reductase [Tissierellia bacterium]
MKAIVAVDSNWGIGRDNNLLISIPEDMKFFREKTMGKTLILGRKNLESFPNKKPLKNRRHIVLTRNKDYEADGVEIVYSIDEALEKVKDIDSDDIYVVGGQSVYEDFLNYCDIIYVTKIKKDLNAEKFFPNLDKLENWEKIYESEKNEHKGIEYIFTTYKNNNL